MKRLKTYMPCHAEPSWFVIDAKGKRLGRVATQAATLLLGKHKPTYAPHMPGDAVIIINAADIECTTKEKVYHWHTGYPGGIKQESFAHRKERKPEMLLQQAVKRMLPRGPRGYEMQRRLKVYATAQHPHTAQNPTVLSEEE